MTDNKKLYEQKLQAQLDEWKAEIVKLKAKASGLTADVQIQMNQKFEKLQNKLDHGKEELAKLVAASENSWESMKTEIESTWNALKTAFHEATTENKKT